MEHRSEHRTARRVLAAMGGLLLLTALLVADATPARAAVFFNSTTINVPAGQPGMTSGIASPYPSTISVAGLGGTITDVNVTLSLMNHTFTDDIDVIVVAPLGQRVRLMTDVGGGTDLVGTTLTFDDAAATFLPDSTQISSGNFRPTFGASGGDFNGPAPAPAAPYSSVLSTFNGLQASGTWQLFVFDDAGGDSGAIVGGWSLNIKTNAPTVDSFNPTSGTPGTVVTITGTNFSGTTTVRFGGVASAVFTEDSPTQISATVPEGALTGPISVTTPQGTGNSSTDFTVNASPPTVTLLTPDEGSVGDQIKINGTNLTGATSVTFNGTPSAAFAVDSSTQITATVPAGATTGPVEVTTAGGTAASTTDFTVRHKRTITINLAGKNAKGNVTVNDGFSACASNVPVKLKHKEGGSFKTVGSTTTDAAGAYKFSGVTDPGKYQAFAKGVTLASGDVCVKDKSPVSTN